MYELSQPFGILKSVLANAAWQELFEYFHIIFLVPVVTTQIQLCTYTAHSIGAYRTVRRHVLEETGGDRELHENSKLVGTGFETLQYLSQRNHSSAHRLYSVVLDTVKHLIECQKVATFV